MERIPWTMALGFFLVSYIIFFSYSSYFSIHQFQRFSSTHPSRYIGKAFLINTTQCKIENLNPYQEELQPFLYNVDPIKCSDKGLLTYITSDTRSISRQTLLKINQTITKEYSFFPISCCYRIISRNESSKNPDHDIIYSECIPFTDTAAINNDTIKVECRNFLRIIIYANVHFIFFEPKKVEMHESQFNILMIGIDSVSRLSFMRNMPQTLKFCQKHGWINLKGYNKVGLNTFPNLMPVLTGMDYHNSGKRCNPNDINGLIQCDFIWNHYKECNYSTLYAEDSKTDATFTYMKKGFHTPPTDYYVRPYFIATESLSVSKIQCSRPQCLGPENTGSRMLNIIRGFTSTIRNRTRGFGLFWMNSFSHADMNCPKSMDKEISTIFKDLHKSGVLDDSIVIFLSDHGFRFGNVMFTHNGWIESRLPFIYISLPEKFREKHKQLHKNLVANSEKLTTPYDLHMTLQHILSLSNPQYRETQAANCPKCTSLLREIDINRTCADAGIPADWCTCSNYTLIDVQAPIVQDTAKRIESELNGILNEHPNHCAKYVVEKVNHAMLLVLKEDVHENIRLSITFFPKASFEVTVNINYDSPKRINPKFTVTSTVRLDSYDNRSWCVKNNSQLKRYCFCKSVLERALNIFCNNKFCLLYFKSFNIL